MSRKIVFFNHFNNYRCKIVLGLATGGISPAQDCGLACLDDYYCLSHDGFRLAHGHANILLIN